MLQRIISGHDISHGHVGAYLEVSRRGTYLWQCKLRLEKSCLAHEKQHEWAVLISATYQLHGAECIQLSVGSSIHIVYVQAEFCTASIHT